MNNSKKLDRSFLWTVVTLVLFGFLVFYSASTGLAARNGTDFYGIIFTQFSVGLVGGILAMFLFSFINHDIIKKYGMLIFILSLIATFTVFVPGLGIEHGGSIRWIQIGGISFQPSEFLKVASIIFIASWFNFHKNKMKEPWFAVISVLATVLLIAIPLTLQRDFDVIILIALVLGSMYFVSKAPIKMVLILGSIILLISTILVFSVPHIKSRVLGYLNPESGAQTVNYQAQQSQIAIGSGGIFGKGFGQSTQKFGSLPEPTNDSIFAVLGEEFGLLGASFLILMYLLFAIFGYKISTNTKTTFGSLFTFGIITLILIQSFMNIASMVGIFPITGQPLVFVSHGGTSMLVTLAMIGIILNISKTTVKN